jgi:2Fe-2S ferredoxin
MPVISFVKTRPSVEVASGTNLMQALLDAGRPVASSCRGDGVCGKCRIQIVAGQISPPSDREKFLIERHSVPAGSRVSCQVSVTSDLTVDASYW